MAELTQTGIVKTGDTALGIAKSLGQTAEQFLANNPTFAAKGSRGDYAGLTGLIQPGQTYNIGSPVAPAPTVESSTIARDATTNNITDLSKLTEQQRLAQEKANQQSTTESANLPTQDSTIDQLAKAVGVDTPEEQKQVQTLMAEFNINEQSAIELFNNPAQQTLFRQTSANLAADKKIIDDLNNRIQQGIIDPSTQAIILGIQNTYARAIATQEDLNKRVIAGTEQRGFRTGRTRYASEVQAGILGDVERRAIGAIHALESERDQLIAAAKAAQNAKDFERLDKLMTEFRTTDIKRLEAMTTLNKEANKRVDEILKKQREVEQKQAQEAQAFAQETYILSLLQQGITDPTELYSMLNFDEQGNQIGQVSIEDITDIMDLVKTKEEITKKSTSVKSTSSSTTQTTTPSTTSASGIISGTESQPLFSPVQGVGALSPKGQWQFDGEQWQPVAKEKQPLNQYDLTSTTGWLEAINAGYNVADVSAYADLNTKLTADRLSALSKAVQGEVSKVSGDAGFISQVKAVLQEMKDQGISKKAAEELAVDKYGEELGKELVDQVY